MATMEEEIKDLKEKNNELVQKVQYWKMAAAQRENEKLNLMKEMNDLRLKLSRLRSNGGVQAQKLDVALQAANEKALAHLVRASSEIARSMDLAKAYMRDREELNNISPRWSNISGTPTERSDRVHRVPPLMMGGQSLQPVVALRRTILNTSNPRSTSRSPNQNRTGTERAVPMHMLQDVYIPLTRIDAGDMRTSNVETENEVNNANDSTEDLGLDDSAERVVEEAHMSEDENFDESHRLDAVVEDPEDEIESPPMSNPVENPMEGPSWLLDTPVNSKVTQRSRVTPEPDSTTELVDSSLLQLDLRPNGDERASARASCAFSPTVRRRKRASSPALAYSPRALAARRTSNNGRVLKVLVAKMHLDAAADEQSPPKRPLRLDAPSPNGATDAGVIVLESNLNQSLKRIPGPASVTMRRSRDSRHEARPDEPDPCPQNSSTQQDVDMETINDSIHRNEDRLDSVPRSHSRLDSMNGGNDSREERTESRSGRSDRKPGRSDSRPGRSDSRPGRSDSRLDSINGSNDSRDSDSGSGGEQISEGRTRRARKAVTYKEKPLNRKMRR